MSCGCKKIQELTQFNMEYDESVTLPGTVGINLPFNVATPPVTSNSESTFAVNDTNKDLIEDIRLKTLDLTVNSPTNGDFSFLESISVFIAAQDLPEIRVAFAENIDSNIGNVLALSTVDVNLKDYIIKDQFTLRVSATKDEVETNDYEINIHSLFFVDAKILGQ